MSVYSPKPAPFDPEQLSRYVESELIAIAENLNSSVQRAYGGLFQVAAPVIVASSVGTPIVYDAFDQELPNETESAGVLVSVPDSSLTILTAGVFLLDFSATSIAIPVNAEYIFELTKNGVLGPAGGRVDPSNQSAAATIAFGGIVNYERGDVLQVLITSPSLDDWTAESSQFFVHRVSESFD